MRCCICSQVISEMNHDPESNTCNNCQALMKEDEEKFNKKQAAKYKPKKRGKKKCK